ncbi:hypothetical protein CPB85DRAFT_191633 [Mucidula mucida]|nr:hypothetical protein CPB85DRAFT_191633 [Mucidula mucida]
MGVTICVTVTHAHKCKPRFRTPDLQRPNFPPIMSSPSRSEKMLRDMLSSAPPSPPTPRHRRRHSTPAAATACCEQEREDVMLSPHEQVLRVRLERVLMERVSVLHAIHDPFLNIAQSHSRSVSRSRSQTHGGNSSPKTSLLTPPPTPPRDQPSPSASSDSSSSSSADELPMTPSLPPTPSRKFNARTASLQCRLIDGYVSFAAIEGLGAPPDPPEEPTKVDPSWRRVLRWVS